MAVFTLPYDIQEVELRVPDAIRSDLILPAHFPSPNNPTYLVRKSLEEPQMFDWRLHSRTKSVAIAINDKTRPVPHDVILPVLVEFLELNGIAAPNITFWVATGTHVPMRPEEFQRIMPQALLDKYSIFSHDINQEAALIYLGKTSFGTETWVNKYFYDADLKIVVGNIEPHHFAGFSGGMKTAAIGLGGRNSINHNHAMLSHPKAWIGEYENNPLRQDIEEMGRLIGVNLAVNVILNQDREIVASCAGDPAAVMQAGIPLARQICGVQADADYDMVIASAGGKPKDINFYQAQKALTHASLFAKPGAPILLVAACPEGSGNASYESLMMQMGSVSEIFHHFEENPFRVGPHKALQVARILQRNPVILVSSMPEALTRQLLLEPASSLQSAVDAWVTKTAPKKIAIVPHATTTLRI